MSVIPELRNKISVLNSYSTGTGLITLTEKGEI
jgi:hypothetical protein